MLSCQRLLAGSGPWGALWEIWGREKNELGYLLSRLSLHWFSHCSLFSLGPECSGSRISTESASLQHTVWFPYAPTFVSSPIFWYFVELSYVSVTSVSCSKTDWYNFLLYPWLLILQTKFKMEKGGFFCLFFFFATLYHHKFCSLLGTCVWKTNLKVNNGVFLYCRTWPSL